MKKKSKKIMFKRPLAVVLAAAMVLSGIQGSRAYALTPAVTQESQKDVVVLDVSTAEDFVALKSTIAQYDKATTGRIEINIKSDLDLSAVKDWEPINVNTSSIKLAMSSSSLCTISNLTINSGSNVGIFGELKCCAEIYNLDFDNIKVTAKGNNVGVLAGKMSGEDISIEMVNIYQPTIEEANDAELTNVGGVVGCISSKSVELNNVEVYNNIEESEGNDEGTGVGVIKGTNAVGGIVGCMELGNITSCKNLVSVTGTASSKNVGGLVGYLGTDKTKNRIDSANIVTSDNYGDVTGNTNVGGVVGSIDESGSCGTESNTANYGTVKGNKNVGGIVGSNAGRIVADEDDTSVHNHGDVVCGELSVNVGGVCGWNTGVIMNAKNSANVTGGVNVGGIVGKNEGEIKKCTNNGKVSGKENVGGIAGENNGTISLSKNNGNVSGDNNVGGIAGSNKGDIKDNCVNNGDVSGKENVGGIAGENQGNISDAKNTGSVTGDKNVGGIAGKNEGTISNSTNEGSVTGTDKDTTGGLVGTNETPNGDDSNITNSTNTGNVNGETATDDKNVGQNIKKDGEADPTQTPGVTTNSPEPISSVSPSQAPDAGTKPSQTPAASTSPSQTPAVSPSPSPSAGNVQYGTPTYNTGGTTVINYITNPASSTWDKQIRFGYIFTVGNYTYRITKSTLIGDAVNTVEVYRVANRSLKTMQIKNQVKLGTQFYNIVTIRNDVAKKYSSVKKVVIGDKVTKIGSRAFMGCKKLKKVNIDSKKLKKIGINAFSGCKKLKKVVIVSSKVKNVGKNAFKNTSKKLVIDVPNKKVKNYKKVFAKSGKAKKAVIK